MGIFPLHIPAWNTVLDRIPNHVPGICRSEANSRILKSDQSGRIYLLPHRGQRRGARLVNTLSELKVGETGVIETLDLPESVQNYLMHLGFLPEAHVMVLRRAPAGDPTVYAVDGLEIALRHETASAIRIHQPEDPAAGAQSPVAAKAEPETKLPALHEIPASVELAEGVAR